jgi:cytochrome P450
MDQDPLFDYYSPEFRTDPYPFYRRLREEDPIHWGMPFEPHFEGAWHIACYSDVNAMLKDPRLGKADRANERMAALPVEAQEYLGMLSLALLRADPPDHTRLRALVSKAFTPRMVENLRPRIAAIATALLDETEGEPEMDLIDQYAFPTSITVITEMLGLSYDDRELLKRWSRALVAAQECKRTPDIYGPASAASAELVAFFHEQIERQREHPRPGILSDLIAARDQDGDRLSENELIVTCALLLIAGHDTTVNLIGNGMFALLRNPGQLVLLRENRDLVNPAVEEFLRYDSSSQMTGRIAREDVEYGGKVIHAGDQINLLLGSANHDPAQFTDPDTLDITRKDNRHIAFGHGIHFCLGAPLARLEAQVAIPLLLRRRPGLRLADKKPERRETIGFRGLAHLPVAG